MAIKLKLSQKKGFFKYSFLALKLILKGSGDFFSKAKAIGRGIKATNQAASQLGWPRVEKTRLLTS